MSLTAHQFARSVTLGALSQSVSSHIHTHLHTRTARACVICKPPSDHLAGKSHLPDQAWHGLEDCLACRACHFGRECQPIIPKQNIHPEMRLGMVSCSFLLFSMLFYNCRWFPNKFPIIISMTFSVFAMVSHSSHDFSNGSQCFSIISYGFLWFPIVF